MRSSSLFFIRSVPPFGPDDHSTSSDFLSEVLLQGPVHGVHGGNRGIIAVSSVALLVMMMVMMQVMMRDLLLGRVGQVGIMLADRGVRVLLQRRVTRFLDADLLDQGRRRGGGAAGAGTTPGDPGIRAPVRRLAIRVGHVQRTCDRGMENFIEWRSLPPGCIRSD